VVKFIRVGRSPWAVFKVKCVVSDCPSNVAVRYVGENKSII
jgi:hypothetical protein